MPTLKPYGVHELKPFSCVAAVNEAQKYKDLCTFHSTGSTTRNIPTLLNSAAFSVLTYTLSIYTFYKISGLDFWLIVDVGVWNESGQ